MRRSALILGGARSGKSRMGEQIADRLSRERGARKIYIATARQRWDGVEDPEFAARIAEHQARRGAGWETIEAPLALPEALARAAAADCVILADCLTLWLSNLMLERPEPDAAALDAATDALLRSLRVLSGTAVLVSNEVGLGLVPETPLGRRFRDAQGRLNQKVAAEADLAVLMAAGLPLTLKGVLSEWV